MVRKAHSIKYYLVIKKSSYLPLHCIHYKCCCFIDTTVCMIYFEFITWTVNPNDLKIISTVLTTPIKRQIPLTDIFCNLSYSWQHLKTAWNPPSYTKDECITIARCKLKFITRLCRNSFEREIMLRISSKK